MENNKSLTAVEWLVEQYEKAFTLKVNNVMTSIIEQAKEMEKRQIIDAYKFGLSDEYVIGSDKYYTSTYGSKGSDNSPKIEKKDSFGEISDEEIEEASLNIEHYNLDMIVMERIMWRNGAKWYREQLKSKQ